jgi:predicted acetyltransferase
MSEWFGNEVLPDGSFAYDLERWWREREVYLATAADALVGFAVIGNAQQWTGNPAAHDVAEFFVLRKYRRQGVGNSLAQLVWNQHPGEWLVRVLAANLPAVAFWRRAITQCNATHQEQQLSIGDRSWIFLRLQR